MKKYLVAALAAASFATPAFAQDGAGNFTGGHIEVIGGFDLTSADGDGEKGVLYGVSGGYDFGSPAGAIFGVEAEVTDATTDDCDLGACTDAERDLYVGGRVGTVVGGSALVYVKAGYTNARAVFEDATTEIGTNLDGVRAGLGVESNIGGPVLVKLEYRYSNYEADVSRHQAVMGIGIRF